LAILAVVGSVILDHPPQPIANFSIADLTQAVSRHDVESLQYVAATNELVGRIRSDKQKSYGGDEFRLSTTLPLALYREIEAQHLSQRRFLGGLEDFASNADYSAQLRLSSVKTAPMGPFAKDEEATYEIKVLGMSVAELGLTVLSAQSVQGEPCYHFSMHAQTSPTFASVYRVDDTAETYVRVRDFAPQAFTLSLNESERFGHLAEVREGGEHVRTWQRDVSNRQGLVIGSDVVVRPLEWQNLISAIFDLRRRSWAQPQSLTILDQGKKIELQLRRVRSEVLNTVLGRLTANVLQPQQVQIDAESQPSPVTVWINESEPHQLLRIEADLKLGHAVAELKSYHSL
jgi:hypothetical protein